MTDQPNNNAQASVGEKKLLQIDGDGNMRLYAHDEPSKYRYLCRLQDAKYHTVPFVEAVNQEVSRQLSAVLAEKGKELELLREENKHLTAPTYEPQITKWLSDKESENSRLRQIVSGMREGDDLVATLHRLFVGEELLDWLEVTATSLTFAGGETLDLDTEEPLRVILERAMKKSCWGGKQ